MVAVERAMHKSLRVARIHERAGLNDRTAYKVE